MSSLQEGSIIAERYRLERLLARGGMGSVWKAQHLQLNVDVAIKLMSPAFASSADARVRFEREAKASAQLKSPYVVQVHDYGIADDSPYIVMELLDGEDLEARLQRERRLSLAATLSIISQACKALRRAHEVGIVHRDLKPANIFLARSGGEELVKVLDFGIAKVTGPALVGQATKTGTLLGSPHYMSPEQVRRSKEVDHRSDLWSLGVIVFRCLTGQLPFPGDEIGDVLVEICTDPIPVASRIVPELGPSVDSFFERALMRAPEQRFQSAGAFVEALTSLVRDSGQMPAGAEMWALDSARHSAPTLGELPTRVSSAPSGSQAFPPGGAGAFAPSGSQALPPGGAGAFAPSGSQALPPGGAGTLAPSGHSLAETPKSGFRPGLLLAIGGGVLAVVIAAFTLLRSPEMKSEAAAPGPPAAPSSAAAPPSAAAPAPSPPPTPAPVAPSAETAPTISSAAASASSQSNRPSPRKGGSTPTRKTRPSDDPLDRM